MPPPNIQRRRAIADGAIGLIADVGLRRLTHRAVDQRVGLPVGTTANYFPTRDALLVATAQRIVDLHRDDIERATAAQLSERGAQEPGTVQDVIDLLTRSLFDAATTFRARYLAVFELQFEARHRPLLRETMVGLVGQSVEFSGEHHRTLQLPIPAQAVAGLVTLYGGALLALVSLPEDEVTEVAARSLAEAMVLGAVNTRPSTG